MRSIQRRFETLQQKNGDLSTYTNFAKAVKQQNFSKNIIARWFNKLVEKDDYNKKDKKKLIQDLWELSKGREESEFETLPRSPLKI